MYLHFFINERMEEFEFVEAAANLDDIRKEKTLLTLFADITLFCVFLLTLLFLV